MHQFHKFILAWNSTCFGQFLCPLSGVYSLYTQQWYMSYEFVDSFRAGSGSWSCSCSKALYKPVWHTPLLNVQWINSWWWTEELSETCWFSCQNKFVKLVHLVGFILKKFYGEFEVQFGIRWRWVSDRIAPSPPSLYHRRRSQSYPLNRRLAGLQRWSGQSREQEGFLLLPGINSKYLCRTACT
jgi:hypothetical protein